MEKPILYFFLNDDLPKEALEFHQKSIKKEREEILKEVKNIFNKIAYNQPNYYWKQLIHRIIGQFMQIQYNSLILSDIKLIANERLFFIDNILDEVEFNLINESEQNLYWFKSKKKLALVRDYLKEIREQIKRGEMLIYFLNDTYTFKKIKEVGKRKIECLDIGWREFNIWDKSDWLKGNNLKQAKNNIDLIEFKPRCTSENFKKNLSELCKTCPIRPKIEKGTKEQIIFQAEEQQEILTEEQFEKYLNEEIENAQSNMKRAHLHYTNPDEYGTNNFSGLIEIYIWNKERIKALNQFQNKKMLPMEQRGEDITYTLTIKDWESGRFEIGKLLMRANESYFEPAKDRTRHYVMEDKEMEKTVLAYLHKEFGEEGLMYHDLLQTLIEKHKKSLTTKWTKQSYYNFILFEVLEKFKEIQDKQFPEITKGKILKVLEEKRISYERYKEKTIQHNDDMDRRLYGHTKFKHDVIFDFYQTLFYDTEDEIKKPEVIENVKLTHNQISLLYLYLEHLITENNCSKIAVKYGQISRTSGQQLLDKFRSIETPEQRLNHRYAKRDIRKVIEVLKKKYPKEKNAIQQAEKELNTVITRKNR